MRININEQTIVCILIITAFMTNVASATTAELTTGKLPDKLKEGEQVDFTIKIKNYENAEQLILETNLLPSATDKPIWNFGESEQVIDANRYSQKITLNLTGLPIFLNVKVSGKVPEGIDKVKCDDIVLNKMHNTKLKFYEIRTDEKLVGIESFELIITAKEEFEKTLENVRGTEFDEIKQELRKIFYSGITTESQNIATSLNNMKRPDNLKLFFFVPINSDTMLNIITVIMMLLIFIVGYKLGSRDPNENNETNFNNENL